MRFVILLAAVVPLFAQPAPRKKAPAASKSAAAVPAKWPVESLSVEGNRVYTREQVLSVAGLKVGQMAGKADFDAARDRLVASGAFDTVGYKFLPGAKGGYAATFQVSEFELICPVEFQDLHVSSLDLAGVLHAKDPLFSMEKLPATQPVFERYARWIEEYLASKGVSEKIAGSVAPAPSGGYVIVFRPTRGLPAVARITFEGNQVLTETALREAVSGVAIGAPYSEDSFRQLLNASLRPVYEARGRVRVAFPEIRSEPEKDVKGVHVIVTVNEGPSYELGKVAIEGPSPVAPDALLKVGDFKTGDVANFDRVAQGLERIAKAVRRAGYMDAKVTSDRHIDDAQHKVDIAVRIAPGAQFTMGKLAIVGLGLDGEAEMKRMWTMKEGKPFNPEYPQTFLTFVHEQGLFDNLGQTKSDVKLNPADHTADVTLTFHGGESDKGKPAGGGRGREFTRSYRPR